MFNGRRLEAGVEGMADWIERRKREEALRPRVWSSEKDLWCSVSDRLASVDVIGGRCWWIRDLLRFCSSVSGGHVLITGERKQDSTQELWWPCVYLALIVDGGASRVWSSA